MWNGHWTEMIHRLKALKAWKFSSLFKIILIHVKLRLMFYFVVNWLFFLILENKGSDKKLIICRGVFKKVQSFRTNKCHQSKVLCLPSQ
jgi:hypothetical protein